MALLLRRRGITRVRPLAGGLDEWLRLGLPLSEVMVLTSTSDGAPAVAVPVVALPTATVPSAGVPRGVTPTLPAASGDAGLEVPRAAPPR